MRQSKSFMEQIPGQSERSGEKEKEREREREREKRGTNLFESKTKLNQFVCRRWFAVANF